MASDLTSRVAGLNPFGSKGGSKKKRETEAEEDRGEGIDVRGAGSRVYHGVSRDEVRVSRALKSFLVHHQALSEAEADADNEGLTTDALRKFAARPYVDVPREATDFSHPLPDYFISSSHNTYLMAHQLYGTTCASAYETAVKSGARCVEIDAWDNSDAPDEPKVTHGYTLVSNVPFRLVCETLRDVYDAEKADYERNPSQAAPLTPIMISLENHCDAKGQRRLAAIMREVFGHRLLDRATNADSPDHVSLNELGHKIVVIVEFHMVGEPKDDDDSDSSSDSSDDEAGDKKKARKEYKNNKTKESEGSSVIVPELAQLGVYAQSVKPPDNSWFEAGTLANAPHHPLINVSETGLAGHLPGKAALVAKHNARHLMRVYPKGTRISSSNLKPVPFWNVGAQICALNGQNFGTSNQINDALFTGTGGYILKPRALRQGGSGVLTGERKRKLRLHLAGASDIPLPKGVSDASDLRPYASCTLFHVDNMGRDPPKRKTSPYKPSKLGFLHRGDSPEPTDPVWDEVLEWEYRENELVFVRILIKNDVSWAGNTNMLTLAVRLEHVVPGWTLLRMLDLKGGDTKCTILAKFEFVDA